MLGKLIKHEWKSTYKAGCLMLFLTLLLTLFGWLSFQTPLWQQLSNETYQYSFSPLDILSIASLLMYFFMLMGISCGIVIYLGVHFYQTMYTDQGYLTHTLPVGRHQLLCSKILVSGIWLLLTSIFILLSSLVVACSLVSVVLPDGYTLASLWKEYSGDIMRFFSILGEEMGVDLGKFLAMGIVEVVIGSFLSVAILFGSITLGQLFSKVRILMAIVCYVVVTVIINMITSLVQSILSLNSLDLGAAMDVGVIVEAVAAVLLYFVSYRIITRRLNME